MLLSKIFINKRIVFKTCTEIYKIFTDQIRILSELLDLNGKRIDEFGSLNFKRMKTLFFMFLSLKCVLFKQEPTWPKI